MLLSIGRISFLWCFIFSNGLLLSFSCAGDLASAPVGAKGGSDFSNDGEGTIEKCLRNAEPAIQVGIYQDQFISMDENNELSLQSDPDGGLSAVVALHLVGICPEELSTITLSIERNESVIANASFDYFEGFCTADIAWLIPQMGIPFSPGISLFDLVDQTATLKINIQQTDDAALSTEVDVIITP